MLIFYGQGLNFGADQEKKSGMTHVDEAPFRFSGSETPLFPLLLAVPHAGRYYPDEVRSRCAVAPYILNRLEDRHADALIGDLVGRGFGMLVAHIARATIDLNRDPRDIDRRMISGLPHGQALIETAKSRGGLGLFPRSLPRIGPLWRHPLPWSEARERIDTIHAPYHARLEREMTRIFTLHGQALLLDVHSMPPLEQGRFADGPRPDVVIGDRYGASAAPRFAELARQVAMRHGLVAAVNHPYPGSYTLERHGRPAQGRHAIQIEISRDLYLDARLDALGEGVDATRAMLTELALTLAEEMRGEALPVAAE